MKTSSQINNTLVKNFRSKFLFIIIPGILVVIALFFISNINNDKTISIDKTDSLTTGKNEIPSDSISTFQYKIEEIGRSNNNLPISAHIFSDGEKVILIIAGIHGNEPSSESLAKELISSLQNDTISKALKVIIVPSVNPDGLKSYTRANANGVDINRNFPTSNWSPIPTKERYYPGKEPASEPETIVIMKLLEKFNPVLVFTIHSPLACVNWDGPANEVAEIISRISGYPLKENIGYDTPGSLGTYTGVEKNIPIITLELRGTENERQTSINIEAFHEVFDYIVTQDAEKE